MTAGVAPTLLPSDTSGNEGNKLEAAKEDRIDVGLVERAVHALLQHLQRSKKEQRIESLLDDEERIVLQFSLVKIPTPSGRTSGKPTLIRIPHSIWKAKGSSDEDINDGEPPERVEDADTCIIVKDKMTKANIKEMIPLFPTHLGNVKKIIPLESLRKKYSQFQQRRELLHLYTIFLADDRILPMVGSLLGKSFFQSKKQPIPVCVTRKGSFPFAVRNSITNTHLFLPSGTCIGLRIGHSEMSPSDLVENCVAASYHVVERIPGKWSNIKSISVKSTNSVSLPFYTVTPKELLQLFPRKVDIKPNKNNVDQEENHKEENEKDIVESTSKNKMRIRKKKLKNSPNTHTTTIDDDDNGKKKKNKEASKSPLLVALKKQKEHEAQLQALAGHTFESDIDKNLTIPNEGSSVNAGESTKKIKGTKRKESVANTTTAAATTTSSPSDAATDSTQNKKKKKIDNIPLNKNDAEELKQGKKKTKDNKGNISLNRNDAEELKQGKKKTKDNKDNISLNRNDGEDIKQETKDNKDNIPLNRNDGEDIKKEKQKMKDNTVNRKSDGKGLKNRKGK